MAKDFEQGLSGGDQITKFRLRSYYPIDQQIYFDGEWIKEAEESAKNYHAKLASDSPLNRETFLEIHPEMVRAVRNGRKSRR